MSENETQLVRTDDTDLQETRSRVSPITRILQNAGLDNGEYRTFSQVAEIYGRHPQTIRNLSRARDENGERLIKGPSYKVKHGKMTIYLFDKSDLEDLDHYFNDLDKPEVIER